MIRKIAMTGVLAAIATVLMFLHFQLPFMPSFISLDFSELPALIAAFTLGPVSGVAVCFVKNLVLLSQTITGGVGELSNFIIGSAFVVPAGLIYRHHRNYGGAIVGSVVGALLMAVLGFFSNLFTFSNKEKHAQRYQISVQETSDKSEIVVLDDKGQPEKTSTGRKIMDLLYEQLR